MFALAEDKDEVPPPREHPWTVADANPEWRYCDFKAHPELIRTALEDFTPFAQYEAVETFFQLVEWLNGPESQLETNDCGLRPPRIDDEPPDLIPPGLNVVMHGRLAVMFRKLEYNTHRDKLDWLREGTIKALRDMGPNFPAVVKVGEWSHFFTEIDEPGNVLTFRYWAWGEDTDAAMHNLTGVYLGLSHCFKSASTCIR